MRALTTSLFVLGAVSGTALGLAIYNVRTAEPIPPADLVVTVPPAAVTVTVPVPAAEPAPEPIVDAPVEAPAKPVRAATPRLWAQCVDLNAADRATECGWDDGFPAISRDGTTIAMKVIPDDGGRGYPGLFVRLLDTASGRVTRTIEILNPDHYLEPSDTDDDATRAKVKRLNTAIAARVKSTQALLDRGGYRTLAALGAWDDMAGHDPDGEPAADPIAAHDTTFAEVTGDAAVRVIDPATRGVMFQHQFGIKDPSPGTSDDDCSGWMLRDVAVWWDPQTRVVVASLSYGTGGCMCGIYTHEQIARAPAQLAVPTGG